MLKITDATVILSKMRGSFLGVLLGDSCGSPFEGQSSTEGGDKLVLRKYFDTLEGPMFKAPKKPYTDDTCMTMSLARVLIDKRAIDQKELATSFVKEYYKDPHRGYGEGVVTVFQKLRKTKVLDPLGPATEQFGGTGSFGNGGAMRVAPVSLFCHNKSIIEIIDMARQSAEVTHTHSQGINGTILQALAIHTAIHHDPSKELDVQEFVNQLLFRMEDVESKDNDGFGQDAPVYYKQLKHVSRLLAIENGPSSVEVLNVLGTSVAALYSVPTAIYCFLRSLKELPDNHTSNPFRRTIEYAISLGGDTDTIASMAGAISGAFHGDTVIPKNLIQHCEAHEEIIELAEKLYQASVLS